MNIFYKGSRNLKQKTKSFKGKNASSRKWLNRHLNDPYVALAKQQAFRSRAAFKLIQINEKFKLLEHAKVIIDIGCAPGGWLQVCRQISPKAIVMGIDITEVMPIEGAQFIQGDIYDDKTIMQIANLTPEKADLIMSDMAAPSSGDQELDHLRNMGLIEQALMLVQHHLREGGNFIAKVLPGREEQNLLKHLREKFGSVKRFKPDASYSDSSEFFIVCLGFKQ
jgi:23S rRNA (uridine2552-2'-O)-methyltransferase